MWIEHISDLQAVAFVLGVIGVVWLAMRLLPGVAVPPRPRRTWTDPEIQAYDPALPKYLAVAGVALALGGLHAAVKSLPPVFAWLSEAGYAGHIVRDLANSHLVIVIGGTIAASALAWYVLPRILRRPLYSTTLANWSFWCTLLGAGGFYLTLTVTGIVMGGMVRSGMPYDEAKASLGAARAMPIALTATVMGIGYWTFVANVLLTVRGARDVAVPGPQRHLAKFFAIGAIGLLIGTVQGVIQVLPSPEAWIHATGSAGRAIDPIAHAHVNLVTGTLAIIAGSLFFWAPRGTSATGRRVEQAVFWTMIPGSLLFYAAFMGLGIVTGRAILGGPEDLALLQTLGPPFRVAQMAGGVLMLAGIWLLLASVARRFLRGDQRRLGVTPLVAVAVIALFVGTAQGLIQLLPPIHMWLESAGPGDEVANAHAQLNMLGGAVPALLAAAFAAGPTLVGRAVQPAVVRRAAAFIGGGIAVYYVSATLTSIVLGEAYRAGEPAAAGLARVQPLGPLGMAAGAALYGTGYALVAHEIWVASATARARGRAGFRAGLARIDDAHAPWRTMIPLRHLVGAETVGAFAGFPGLGWLLLGRATIGIPLALLGPGIAWAVIPVLTSPEAGTPLSGAGATSIVAWIAVVATLSVAGLTFAARNRGRSQPPVPGGADGEARARAAISTGSGVR